MTEIKKGLAGVVVDETAVSKVVAETNSLTYRGYAVQELAEHCSFEQVAYLLLNGELPTQKEHDDFVAKERSLRSLSQDLLENLKLLPKNAHPMDTTRHGVNFLGCEDDNAWSHEPKDLMEKSIAMLAKIPTIVAANYRIKNGNDPISPDENLSFAENFFHMCFGKVPDEKVVKCFDISLILYAEHSFNASTFTARVVTSTLADIYSSVVSAIGALKGPLHGGANEAVMYMMKEVDKPENAEQWMLTALKEKRKIMGFGHRVYKNGDSRVPTMKKAFMAMAEHTNGQKWLDMYEKLEETMVREKNIYPNLDFPTGPAYYLMGFPIDMFTPIFIMSRITGWSAHIMEQLASNALIRPLSAYNGEPQRHVKA